MKARRIAIAAVIALGIASTLCGCAETGGEGADQVAGDKGLAAYRLDETGSDRADTALAAGSDAAQAPRQAEGASPGMPVTDDASGEAQGTHAHTWVPRYEGHAVDAAYEDVWVDAAYETVHHDAVYETEIHCYEICSNCGADCTGAANAHIVAHARAGEDASWYSDYDYERVCVSPAYDEQVCVSEAHYERVCVREAAWVEEVVGYECTACGSCY